MNINLDPNVKINELTKEIMEHLDTEIPVRFSRKAKEAMEILVKKCISIGMRQGLVFNKNFSVWVDKEIEE